MTRSILLPPSTHKLRPLLKLAALPGRDNTAFQGGFSSYPMWYLSRAATPAVQMQIGNRKRAMLSRGASDHKRRELIAMSPDFVQ